MWKYVNLTLTHIWTIGEMWFNGLWTVFTIVSMEKSYLECVCSTCIAERVFIYVDGVPGSKMQIHNECQTRQMTLSKSSIATHWIFTYHVYADIELSPSNRLPGPPQTHVITAKRAIEWLSTDGFAANKQGQHPRIYRCYIFSHCCKTCKLQVLQKKCFAKPAICRFCKNTPKLKCLKFKGIRPCPSDSNHFLLGI